MIIWEERFSSGVESVDRQHRMLFEFFNDFEDCIKTGKGELYLDTSFCLLEAYAKAHFKFEENCMQERQCPFAKQNFDAHQVFIVKIQESKTKFSAGGCAHEVLIEIHDFLENWITTHIIAIDVHLKNCIKKD